jgi:four helix bundle protein
MGGCAIEISSYRDLKVWQEARLIAERVYGLTAGLPKEEVYGMTSQIRRAAASVEANIAEGHGREQSGSFVQFLRMAQGSLKELETHLLPVLRVELAASSDTEPVLDRCDELGRMLRSLIRSIQRRHTNG